MANCFESVEEKSSSNFKNPPVGVPRPVRVWHFHSMRSPATARPVLRFWDLLPGPKLDFLGAVLRSPETPSNPKVASKPTKEPTSRSQKLIRRNKDRSWKSVVFQPSQRQLGNPQDGRANSPTSTPGHQQISHCKKLGKEKSFQANVVSLAVNLQTNLNLV